MKYSPDSQKNNTQLIGFFMMYVAIVQLLEYMMWMDMNGKKGWNRLATQIIPYIVYLQPTMIFILGEIQLYLKPNNNVLDSVPGKSNNFWHQSRFHNVWRAINIAYALFAITQISQVFINYRGEILSTAPKCTKVGKDGHLQWNRMFSNLNSYPGYYFLFITNTLYYLDPIYGKVLATLIMISSYISFTYFGYSAAEMWCFFGGILPICILFLGLVKKTVSKLSN